LVQELFDYDLVLNGSALMWLGRIELDQLGSLQTKAIHAQSHADSIDKSRERSVIPKLADLTECLQECVLGDIFGLVPISKQVRSGSYESAPVPVDQASECDLVTFPASADPLTFLGSGFGCESDREICFWHGACGECHFNVHDVDK